MGTNMYVTRNVSNEIGFVSGLLAQVEGFDAVNNGVRLITKSGQRFTSYRWSDKDTGKGVYHPLRLGYASAIIKFQGTELEHLTLYLDIPWVPDAAYTALSRVCSVDDSSPFLSCA